MFPMAKSTQFGNRASDCAAEYFTSCGIAQFDLECKQIVDTQYLNVRSPDQTTCNIKCL